jgi:uncharacterized iron-regulated membrane protein
MRTSRRSDLQIANIYRTFYHNPPPPTGAEDAARGALRSTRPSSSHAAGGDRCTALTAGDGIGISKALHRTFRLQPAKPPERPFLTRTLLVSIHRYLGLVLALFLAVLGVTGSIIAFDDEFDAALNPELFEIEAFGAEPLPAAELIRRVNASNARIEAYRLTLSGSPTRAAVIDVRPRSDPATGEPYALDYDEVFIDPVTGRLTGRRLWGECCFERRNVVPFMYKLHNRLLLPIDIGRPLLGAMALLWLVLLVIGAWLTWPVSRPRLRNRVRSWRVRRGTSGVHTTLAVHRTGGLWLWPVLAALALTGAALGLEDQFRGLVGTAAGDLIMNVSQPLHGGGIAGMPGRIVVFVGGLAVTTLSVTGLVMWGMRRSRLAKRAT